MTYVGKIPEHVTFEFKYGPSNSGHANYIVLPLDTTIRKASQICNDPELGMRNIDKIGVWDVTRQEISNPVTGADALACSLIRMGQDFNVYPGQIYFITIPQETIWHQK
ncbi:MAG: hypothetical protein QW484_03340 [Candidatus Pacearchaeota archaeon]